MTADPARLATARAALAAVHAMHDAALDAANRLLWPLIPRGDATGLASALDAIAEGRVVIQPPTSAARARVAKARNRSE